jgi:CRP-like cAMP-binding protein
VSALAAPDEGGPGLTAFPLLAGIGSADLARLEHFMTRFSAAPGETLFTRGEDCDRMYLIEAGEVEILGALPGGGSRLLGRLGAGELLGETSLLGTGRRTATAVAVPATSGWMLHRSGLETLRLDAAPGSVELTARIAELAAERLHARYAAIGRELGGEPRAQPGERGGVAHAPRGEAMPGVDYLAGLLCFRDFDDLEVQTLVRRGNAVELDPGAIALTPGAAPEGLLMVVRGALDVSIRHDSGVRRVRLAGPGRFVGHACVAAGRAETVAAHARERVIALSLAGELVRGLLREPAAPARRFTAALTADMARAIAQAERPVARMAGDGMLSARV